MLAAPQARRFPRIDALRRVDQFRRSPDMRAVLIALIVLGASACSRTYDGDAFEYRQSQLGSDARQIAQSCLIYESTDSGTDTDHVITLEDLRRTQPGLFGPELMRSIEHQEIVFVPQSMPIQPNSVIVMFRYEDRLGTITGDLTYRFYREKRK